MKLKNMILPALAATALYVAPGCANKNSNGLDSLGGSAAVNLVPDEVNERPGAELDRDDDVCTYSDYVGAPTEIRGMYINPELLERSPGLCELLADLETSPDEVITAVRSAQFNISWAVQKGLMDGDDLVRGLVFAARTSEVVKKNVADLDIDNPSLMGAAVGGRYMTDIVPMYEPLNPERGNHYRNEFFFIMSAPPNVNGGIDARLVVPDFGDKVEASDWYQAGTVKIDPSWSNVAYRQAPMVLGSWRVNLAERDGEDFIYLAIAPMCSSESLECEEPCEPLESRVLWSVRIPVERSALPVEGVFDTGVPQ